MQFLIPHMHFSDCDMCMLCDILVTNHTHRISKYDSARGLPRKRKTCCNHLLEAEFCAVQRGLQLTEFNQYQKIYLDLNWSQTNHLWQTLTGVSLVYGTAGHFGDQFGGGGGGGGQILHLHKPGRFEKSMKLPTLNHDALPNRFHQCCPLPRPDQENLRLYCSLNFTIISLHVKLTETVEAWEPFLSSSVHFEMALFALFLSDSHFVDSTNHIPKTRTEAVLLFYHPKQTLSLSLSKIQHEIKMYS